MIKFSTVRSGLKYVVDNLIPKQRAYIVNIQRFGSNFPRMQVVTQGMIECNNEPGLSVHLPFDVDSGEQKDFMRFLDLELSLDIKQKDFQNIPCFYLDFGCDYEQTDRVILYLLVQLYKYTPSTRFVCEVYDEGPLKRFEGLQAPPGGVIL